jgi:hypothetical protein
MTDELKTLFPGKEVEIAGKKMVIKPFSLGQIPKVAGLFGKLGPALAESNGNIIKMIELGGEPMLDMLALSANKPRSWVDALEPDQGIDLIAAVIEQNKEFFAKKMGPALEKLNLMFAPAAGEKAADMEKSSPDSLPADTPEEK